MKLFCGKSLCAPVALVALVALATVLVFSAGAGCSDNDGHPGVCGDDVCDPGETPSNCPNDCGYCRNGVAEAEHDEQCDTDDLSGMTCETVGCDPGVLSCHDNCMFDTTACGHCTDLCGNGIRDSGENCDCGEDPGNLPAGCSAINGDPQGECRLDCTHNNCEHEVWDPDGCDETQPHEQCCPDNWGNEAMCMPDFTAGAFCVLMCESTSDCHYNNFCFDSVGGCLPYLCGPGGYGDRDRMHDTCEVPGGGPGYCMPFGLAEEQIGFCFENGGIDPHQACTQYRPEVNFPRDEPGLDVCNGGLCADMNRDGTFHCYKFCDWQAVYDDPHNNNPCGAGYNCFAESTIDATDPDTEGRRTADFSFCRPTDQTLPQYGITTCDLLNGELLEDRAQDCSDLSATSLCVPVRFTPPQDCPECDPITWGSLIGACADLGAATPLGIWEECDALNPDEVCQMGSYCAAEDLFEGETGPERCVPFCDTRNESDCANHAGIPVYSICRSLSEYFYPAGDGSPTRLGFCLCPSNGCGLIPQCGNSVREFGELCDGSDVGFHTCQFYGLGDGVMGCTGSCDATDPSNCSTTP